MVMAISPQYQQRGIGSAMMRHICWEVDQNGGCAYVLSSPVGALLYQKFGFEVVKEVETPHGPIISMFRPVQ